MRNVSYKEDKGSNKWNETKEQIQRINEQIDTLVFEIYGIGKEQVLIIDQKI